jgi:hypothetical protein
MDLTDEATIIVALYKAGFKVIAPKPMPPWDEDKHD